MAVMLANGDGIGEIVRAQGLSKSTVKSALERLPRSLGGLSDDK
jgi:DNA-binding CsgD family transcriptional regulator